jgi:hypothetical protein
MHNQVPEAHILLCKFISGVVCGLSIISLHTLFWSDGVCHVLSPNGISDLMHEKLRERLFAFLMLERREMKWSRDLLFRTDILQDNVWLEKITALIVQFMTSQQLHLLLLYSFHFTTLFRLFCLSFSV